MALDVKLMIGLYPYLTTYSMRDPNVLDYLAPWCTGKQLVPPSIMLFIWVMLPVECAGVFFACLD